jgi:hypothetical protein
LSIGETIFVIILGIAWYVNHETRKYINQWSWENNYKIIYKQFYPMYIMMWPRGLTGLHPGCYEVTIKDENENTRVFKIAGGGPFWISGEFEIEEKKY